VSPSQVGSCDIGAVEFGATQARLSQLAVRALFSFAQLLYVSSTGGEEEGEEEE
jgi:hypothetical protein